MVDIMNDENLRTELSSSEDDQGAALVSRSLGGTVRDALRYVSVDGFKPDVTGHLDSTLAVMKAAAVAKTLADSAYVVGDTTYYVVRYGFGIYMQGDVPLYTGITYDGQGAGTLVKPLPGASYCFTTQGTEPYSGNNLKRLLYASITNMHIGCAYYENLYPIPNGVGGINIEYASYIKIDNVTIRALNGIGLNLNEVWDSDIINLRMMKVGNANDMNNPLPALRMGMGNGSDGSNAIRFWGLHIEECPKTMELNPGSRHIFFNSCKFEGGTVTSTIIGAAGISFSDIELTWAKNNMPQFSISRSTAYESFGVSFNTPQINSGGSSPRGWYIHHESNSGHLLISNPSSKFVKTLITGNSFVVLGGIAYACGPNYIDAKGYVTVDGLVARAIQSISTSGSAANDGSEDFIIMSGKGNTIQNCKLHANNSLDSGLAFINIQKCNNDVSCFDNQFSGIRQYGIRATIAGYKIRNNSIVDSGQLVKIISGSSENYSLVNPNTSGLGLGGFSSKSTTLAAGASGVLEIVSGGSLITIRTSSALDFASCLIFLDANSSKVAILASTGNIFATAENTDENGKVYISSSGSNLRLSNRSDKPGTFYATALSVVM